MVKHFGIYHVFIYHVLFHVWYISCFGLNPMDCYRPLQLHGFYFWKYENAIFFFFWYVEFSFSFGALYSYSDPRLIRRQFKKIFLVKKENLHRKIDTRKKKLSRWKVMLLLRLVLLLLPYCYNNCYVIMLQCCNVWNYRSWQQ